MSVIICRKEHVANPWYVDGLGINIHSSQELCYAIYHHPLLFMDGFVDGNLVEFVREELGMGFVAARMEQRIKTGDKPDEILLMFMQECDYYTTAELNKLRQTMTSLRKLSPLEYAKKKADYLAEFKQYGKAIAGYEEILEAAAKQSDAQLEGRVWNNLGACYARIFQFQKAMDAFDKAYGKKKDPLILEKMFYLTCLSPALELKERFRSLVTEKQQEQWEESFKKAQDKAVESPELKKLQELFEKDSQKRAKESAALVEEWKQEYRNMA